MKQPGFRIDPQKSRTIIAWIIGFGCVLLGFLTGVHVGKETINPYVGFVGAVVLGLTHEILSVYVYKNRYA